MDTLETGRWGEAEARGYLEARGYRLVAANYRTRLGELDLVMRNEEFLVFVEVKTREDASFAQPEAFVTPWKRKRIIKAALQFVKAERLAGLPHQKQGGWHVFRRAWATRRKHLPVQDVMEAGGWRDINALQKAYQAADPETVRKVMEVS